MNVYKKNLYTAGGAARKIGAIGELYVVLDNYKVYKVGYIYQPKVRYATEADFTSVTNQDFTKWKQVSFSEILIPCQQKLVFAMGDDFPFAKSRWKTKEEWEEWDNPQTIPGKISKAVRSPNYFKCWLDTNEWETLKKTYPICQKKRYARNVCYIEGEGWFCEEYAWDKNSNITKARLCRIREGEAKALIATANVEE